MRFLVITKNRSPVPPEALTMLLPAMKDWVARHRESGVFEQVWSLAGFQGGGGIANVDTLEQLNSVMAEFPFGPFAETEIYGLADLGEALEDIGRILEMRAAAMGAS